MGYSHKLRFVRTVMLLLLLSLALSLPIAAEEPLIAVLPIEDGDLSWQGFRGEDILNGITQLITDRLVQVEGIRVVERTRILDILDEQDFSRSSRVDPETAAQIGRILGVHSLILTTLTQMDVGQKGGISFGPVSLSGVTAEVVITGRVVDATTAEIKDSYLGEGKATEASLSVSDIRGLSFGTKAFHDSVLGKSIQQAVEDFTAHIIADPQRLLTTIDRLEGRVVAVLGSKVIINAGSNQRVRVRQLGNLIRLVVVEGLAKPVAVPIGRVEVFSVNEDTAIIEVLQSDDPPEVGDYIYLETMIR